MNIKNEFSRRSTVILAVFVTLLLGINAGYSGNLMAVENIEADTPQLHAVQALDDGTYEEIIDEARLGIAAYRYMDRFRNGMSAEMRWALIQLVLREAKEYQVDPLLALAVIGVESSFNLLARSHVGAIGLMQVMPDTGAKLSEKMDVRYNSEEDLYDPETNVTLGVQYLRYLLEKFGNARTALAAYNWGPGAIMKRLKDGRPLPTDYADKVMLHYSRLQARAEFRI